ncbi:MAG TPA: hypothetical protein DD670_16115 [Planctomycetaceae bacterium]|nr:hypothetical protein [Planctomycetaceae bacterium]
MADFHHNIFYFYGGAHPTVQDHERQLENNTTKALINTLQFCNSVVAIRFLKWLGLTATKPVLYELQRASIRQGRIENKRHRMLLGLVPLKKTENHSSSSDPQSIDGDSLPDAWIYGSDFVVLIESKVVGRLHEDQMAKHYARLLPDKGHKPQREERTWADIHRFFMEVVSQDSGNMLSEKDTWIIGQFTRYLEWIGMADYIGIKPEMFDHFAARLDNRSDDTRQWISKSMRAFGEKVRDRLCELPIPFYTHCLPGTLKLRDDHCWVALGPKDLKKVAHQSLSLGADGLEVFVNIEMKALVKKLNKRIGEDRQTFRKIVTQLPRPFYILVQEKEHKQAMLYKPHKIAQFDVGDRDDPRKGSYGLADTALGTRGFDYLEMLLAQIPLLDFSVRKHLERNAVLELSQGSAEALVETVADVMKQLHPLIEFVHR